MSNNKTKLYAFPVKNPSEIEAIRNLLKTKNIENLLYEFNLINDSNKDMLGDLYIEYIEVPDCHTGATGHTGPTGSFSPIGLTGITGLTGDSGITGPFKPRETCSGDTGSFIYIEPTEMAQVETGPTGSFSPIGLTGITGLTGDNGITGPFKPRETACLLGDTGPTGAFMYIEPTEMACLSETGPTGSLMYIEPTEMGPVSTGPTGSFSPIGLTGITGLTGDNGITGPFKPRETACLSETGPTGSLMYIEPTEMGPVSTGPTGSFSPIGLTGITGLTGDNGITGPFKPRETACLSETGPTGSFMYIESSEMACPTGSFSPIELSGPTGSKVGLLIFEIESNIQKKI